LKALSALLAGLIGYPCLSGLDSSRSHTGIALGDAPNLMLNANVESPDESIDPRTISFSGGWIDAERAARRERRQRFNARFFDPKVGAFFELWK
jgi:hypothetical protein